MKSAMLRRLDRVERVLNPAATGFQAISIPDEWADDSDEELDAKLERWKAGEIIGDLPPYNPNAKLLYIISRKFVSPVPAAD